MTKYLFIFAFLICALPAQAQETPGFSGLPELTTLADDDPFAVTDSSASLEKHVLWGTIYAAILAMIDTEGEFESELFGVTTTAELTAGLETQDECSEITNCTPNATVGATWGSNITGQPSVVGQAEAEAGTATTERIWTAQRVAQAVAALPPAAHATSHSDGGSDEIDVSDLSAGDCDGFLGGDGLGTVTCTAGGAEDLSDNRADELQDLTEQSLATTGAVAWNLANGLYAYIDGSTGNVDITTSNISVLGGKLVFINGGTHTLEIDGMAVDVYASDTTTVTVDYVNGDKRIKSDAVLDRLDYFLPLPQDSTITTGDSLVVAIPEAMTVDHVQASLISGSTAGAFTVDIQEDHTTILSSPISIAQDGNWSSTVVPSDTSIASQSFLTIIVADEGAGDAYGLTVHIWVRPQ